MNDSNSLAHTKLSLVIFHNSTQNKVMFCIELLGISERTLEYPRI